MIASTAMLVATPPTGVPAALGAACGVLVLALSTGRFGRSAARSTPEPAAAVPSPGRRPDERWSRAVGQLVRSARQRRLVQSVVPTSDVARWCDSIGRRLRSGTTLRQALSTERPVHPGLVLRTEPLRRGLQQGQSVTEAVEACATTSNHADLDLVWAVLAVAARHGGDTALAIDRVSSALRLRNADRHERAAQSAQARLSAHVLTAVPLGVLALLVGTDADVRDVVTGPTGSALVGSGLLLNLGGWQWMRRIAVGRS